MKNKTKEETYEITEAATSWVMLVPSLAEAKAAKARPCAGMCAVTFITK